MTESNQFKNCSFCNLFSAIQSMMQELKGDHGRKLHNEITEDNITANTNKVNRDLVQPLEDKVVFPEIDVKRENFQTNKQDIVYEYVKNYKDCGLLIDSVEQEISTDYCDEYNTQYTNEKQNNDDDDEYKSDNKIIFLGISDKLKNGANIMLHDNEITTNEHIIANKINNYNDTNDKNSSSKTNEYFEGDNDIKNLINNLHQDGGKPEVSKTENVDSVQVKVKLTKQNLILNHFKIRNEIKNGRECNHCGKVLKSTYGTTTTSLLNHLKRKHPKMLEPQLNQLIIKRSIKKEKNSNKLARSKSNEHKTNKLERSKRSIIWNHCKPSLHGSGGMDCNYCGVKISTTGTTTNMMSHLKNKHPEQLGVQLDKESINPEQFEVQLDKEIEFKKQNNVELEVRLNKKKNNKLGRSNRSIIWDHFKPSTSESDGMECNYCGARISTAGATTNMINHLKNKHPEHLGIQLDKQLEIQLDTDNAYTEKYKGQFNKHNTEELGLQLNKQKRKKAFESLMSDHFQLQSNSKDVMECKYCGTEISNNIKITTKMIKHLKTKHSREMDIYIDSKKRQTQLRLQSEDGVKIENKSEIAEIRKPLNTGLIWEYFTLAPNTEDNVECKHCDYCGKSSRMLRHLKLKHPALMEVLSISRKLKTYKKEIPLEKRTCKYCEKVFSMQTSKIHHIKTVHFKSRSYTCDSCGKHFGLKNSLNRHLSTHAEDLPFKCVYCAKSFIRKHRKDAHEKSHAGIFDYSCDYCSKQFISKERKIHHERIHTGDKPYLCTNCGKAFRLQSHLVTHNRIHTEEKPYHCQKCGNNYRHLSSYNDHRCIPSSLNETGPP